MNDVVIPKDRWKKHLKYVSRLRRKERNKARLLAECQKELRGVDWVMRSFLGVIEMMGKHPL